jgi:formate hydrogenlyase transcriptional activator
MESLRYEPRNNAMRSPDSSEQYATVLAKHEQAEFAQLTLESVFALCSDAIFVTDGDGMIRSSNPKATELFGYAHSELIGMKIDSLLPERFRDRHPIHRDNYNAQPRARQMGHAMKLFGLRKDGTECPVEIMLKPIQTNSGPIVLSFVRDTTEQIAAQEAVRHHDRQIRSIVDSVHDYAIFLLDHDGHVVTWNRGAESIKGYKPEDIVGKHFAQFFTHEDIERGHPAELLRLAGTRGSFEEEGWLVRKDGSRFWAHSILTAVRDEVGTVTGYAKVTRDITNYKGVTDTVMLQLSKALFANMDIRKLLSVVSESIRAVIPHDSATLALYEASTKMMLVQSTGLAEGELHHSDVRFPVAGSPAGEAFLTREPVVLERMEGSRFSVESMRHLTSLGMQSGCWVPLIHRGQTLGTLAVANRLEAAFVTRDASILVQLANQVAIAVNNAVAFREITDVRDRISLEKQYLESEINAENRFEDIVGDSAGLRSVLNDVATVAPTDSTVLIQGETGTGKELLARAIHRLSPRKDRAFIKLNCAAIPEGLLESELFGHEKGAFTGAIARKAGRLELAHDGTLFLDEVGDLPLNLQPKLLRALQEREFERLGGTRPIKVNVRLIVATNRDLAAMVVEKQFRADLFYRLKVFPVFAPSLRDRVGDIPVLVRHFVATHSRRMGKAIKTIPEASMEALMRWKWPGNIRELENFLERAVILTPGSVLFIPRGELVTKNEEQVVEEQISTHESVEREHILRTMRHTKGHISGADGAAARLDLKRTTLNSKLKKLKISKIDYM